MPHDSLRRARFVLRHEPELALSVLYGVEKLRPWARQPNVDEIRQLLADLQSPSHHATAVGTRHGARRAHLLQ